MLRQSTFIIQFPTNPSLCLQTTAEESQGFWTRDHRGWFDVREAGGGSTCADTLDQVNGAPGVATTRGAFLPAWDEDIWLEAVGRRQVAGRPAEAARLAAFVY